MNNFIFSGLQHSSRAIRATGQTWSSYCGGSRAWRMREDDSNRREIGRVSPVSRYLQYLCPMRIILSNVRIYPLKCTRYLSFILFSKGYTNITCQLCVSILYLGFCHFQKPFKASSRMFSCAYLDWKIAQENNEIQKILIMELLGQIFWQRLLK